MKLLDKNKIVLGKQEDIDKMDNEYWSNAPIREKLETITYLRECFYGEEATAGRIQRICTVFKQE